MTSEVKERPRLVTGCYGRHRSQWVKTDIIADTIVRGPKGVHFIQVLLVLLLVRLASMLISYYSGEKHRDYSTNTSVMVQVMFI